MEVRDCFAWGHEHCEVQIGVMHQGPRSNFEIGGGGGVTKHFFLLTLCNFKNIGGGGGAGTPLRRGPSTWGFSTHFWYLAFILQTKDKT